MAKGLDRIEHENENALGDKLASAMIEQASPGVFTGGKEITNTQTTQDPVTGTKVYIFWFDDGSAMRIIGHFDIEYLQPGALSHIASEDDVVEGTAQEEAPEIERGE